MADDLKILINNHELNFHLVDNKNELERVFEYRYKVYLDRKMMTSIGSSNDTDEFDFGQCFQIVATFDGKIVGCVRMIYGEFVPFRDLYFEHKNLELLKKEKIFEVSRLISAPYYETNLVPRHLILLGLFFYGLKLGLQNNFTLAVGGTKKYVIDSLRKVHYPINILEGSSLADFEVRNGPLKPYFKDPTQIYPTYSRCIEGHAHLNAFFNNNFAFDVENHSTLRLRHIFYFNIYLILKALYLF